MKQAQLKGIARLIAAFRNSCNGFRDIWQREEAFRLEVVALLVSVPVGYWLASSLSQFALLVGSILILVIVETLNSAIEAAIDRIGPERHELSRIAKDLGSLAVLMASLLPLGIWLAVVLAKIGWISL